MAYPLVSVCVPCHNAERFIGPALDSVLAQTYQNIEIIVTDDGSTDSTAEALRPYAKRGVKILSAKCGTAARARNHSLSEANGEYVKFFDADDLLSPECIERQIGKLNGHPDSVAASEWGRFFENDLSTFTLNPRPVWRDLPATDWLIQDWMDGQPMTQPGMFLIPRSLIEASGPWLDDPLLHKAPNDDFEFFTRLFCKTQTILFTPGAVLRYRSGHLTSLSQGRSRPTVEALYHCLLRGTQHLLVVRSDSSAKKAAANLLQNFIYAQYPLHRDLTENIQSRISDLGGSDLPPDGPPRFQRLRRFVGWRSARKIQRFFGH